jgi:pimeloyl-ACP methyl ester carboxylesterase
MHHSKSKIVLAAIFALLLNAATAGAASNRIIVTVRGKGPDVVLIPGLACSTAVWDGTVARLQGRYRLHLVQVAGFAGAPSGPNAQGPVLQPVVDAIDAYIRTNKLKSPRVIGHSMGGLMGMMLAIQHPGDVNKLMIVDSLPFFSVLFGANDASGAAFQAGLMRDSILAESQEAYVQGEEGFLQSLVKSPEGLREAAKWASASDKSVVARAMYEVATTDIRRKLREIKSQVTMLYPWDASSGYAESAVDDLYHQNFASLPQKKLVRIDGSYHFIMLDQPEKFEAQVEAFLK